MRGKDEKERKKIRDGGRREEKEEKMRVRHVENSQPKFHLRIQNEMQNPYFTDW